MSISEKVLERIRTARERVSQAEEALDQAVRLIDTAPREDKVLITHGVTQAFEMVRSAREVLFDLERDEADDG